MGRKTKRPIRKRTGSDRPSTFFIIALLLGLALLVFIAMQVIRHPAKQPVQRSGELSHVWREA